MPFNKGDFTQQGVAGHVNANLRLNEKRLVNIDMTSNEDAEGCTIAGTVTDQLNDKVYPIGAGVSGNIEITENGENINVAPYATATVNVAGGGDIKACDITFINESESDAYIGDILAGFPVINNILDAVIFGASTAIPANTSVTYSFLYTVINQGSDPIICLITGSYIPTDLVNCTLVTKEGQTGVEPTDTTENSSCTITITGV